MGTKAIKVEMLARVEGEGGLHLKIRDGKVADVKLNIFEPPRFFEAFLRGRHFTEAPDITARICGICPVAYQMSSALAMENALGISVSPNIRNLRRLLYCGEWIESHALHIYLLHAPDFLGYQDAIALAKDHPDVVKRALELKKIGNALMIAIGGREIHPINVRVGGFYRAPTKTDLLAFRDRLKWALDAAVETVSFVATLEFPEYEPDYEFVSLSAPGEYPIEQGRIVSSGGLDIDVTEYDKEFAEEHVAHSNALHSKLRNRGAYLVGPLARYALNSGKLPPVARQCAHDSGLGPVCRNPFKSIVVRAVELVFACEEAIRLIESYEPPDPATIPLTVRAANGFGCTEAPRGILYHRYRIDASGIIRDAKIVPPTAQNLPSIEDDLRRVAEANISAPQERLQWLCEQTVRNYDPCISCATHFLNLTVDRE